MSARTPKRRQTSATIAGVVRQNGPDDPRLPELRRDLRAAELEEHVRRVVDAAPPLTPEQRDKLAALLRAPSSSVRRNITRPPQQGAGRVRDLVGTDRPSDDGGGTAA
jgi:hypothetical protein